MANTWFRLYAEFATDPKVQMLSESNQRRYIMLLCMRCSNGDVTLHDTEVAFQLRISDEEWASTKAIFVQRGLLTSPGAIANWDKRQYVSDSSAARVSKHREKRKQDRQRACNVTVTPPDTDTDTDTEKRKSKAQAPCVLPDWVPSEAWSGFAAMRVKARKPMTDRAIKLIVSELERLRDAGNDPGAVLDQSTRNNWQDVYALKPRESAKGAPVQSAPVQLFARAV